MQKHQKTELVLGGGGALYPYYSGWAHALYENLPKEKLDNIIYSPHSVSTMLPILLWIANEKGISPKETYYSFDLHLENALSKKWTPIYYGFLDIWYETSIPYIEGLDTKWMEDHTVLTGMTRKGRVVYNRWNDSIDFMKCAISTCFIPSLGYLPLRKYKGTFLFDGCFHPEYHSQTDNPRNLLFDTLRNLPRSRMLKFHKFDDHCQLFNWGYEDMTKYIKETM